MGKLCYRSNASFQRTTYMCKYYYQMSLVVIIEKLNFTVVILYKPVIKLFDKEFGHSISLYNLLEHVDNYLETKFH